MSVQLLVQPTPIAAVSVGGSWPGYLLTADPKEAWVAPSTASLWIDWDMGSAVSIDSIFLGFTNAAADAVWTIFTPPSLGGASGAPVFAQTALRAADSLGPRHHGFVRLPSPVTARYWRLSIGQGSAAAPLEAGALLAGLAFAKPREWGSGRELIDTGSRTDLVSGGFGFAPGVTKARFSWNYIDLSDEELRRLWAIAKNLGTRGRMLLVEDADLTEGRNEAIHYGLFDKFQPYERQDPAATRWSMSMTEWV